MVIYDVVKCAHILSAALVLCLNGILGLSLYIHTQQLTCKHTLHALFVKATHYSVTITLPFGILQAISGFTLIALKGIPMTLPWLYIPMLCFLSSALIWLAILYHHLQCQTALAHGLSSTHPRFKRHFHAACMLGILALILILIATFAMSNLSLHWPTV